MWCGAVQCGVMWCDVVQYSVMYCNIVHCSVVNVIRCTMKVGIIHYNYIIILHPSAACSILIIFYTWIPIT